MRKANKFARDRTRNINVPELMKIENAFTKQILNLYRNFSMHNVRISTRRSSRYKLKPSEELKPTEELHCDLYNQAEKVIEVNDSLQPDTFGEDSFSSFEVKEPDMTRRSLEDILKDLRKDENKFMVMQPPGITCFFTEATSIDISNETSSQEDLSDHSVPERSNSYADSQEVFNNHSVPERYNSEVVSEPELTTSIPERESLGTSVLSTQDLVDILINLNNLNDSETEGITPPDTEIRTVGETTELKTNLSEERLTGNFVSENVFNLSRRVLSESEIRLLSKGLKFVPTPVSINRAQLKLDLEEFGRRLKLKYHFRNHVSENFGHIPSYL